MLFALPKVKCFTAVITAKYLLYLKYVIPSYNRPYPKEFISIILSKSLASHLT